MIRDYTDEIFTAASLFTVAAVIAVAIYFGSQGFPTDARECVSWETTREWVIEAKPMISTGNGMGMGMDGSVGSTFSPSSSGSVTTGVSGSWKDVERCTAWVTPTP